MSERQAVCMTCGHPATDDPFRNRLANGRVCPGCRDRVLEATPAPLPWQPAVSEEERASDETGFDLPSDGWTAESSDIFDHLPGEPPDGPIGAYPPARARSIVATIDSGSGDGRRVVRFRLTVSTSPVRSTSPSGRRVTS